MEITKKFLKDEEKRPKCLEIKKYSSGAPLVK